jgi:hypothetical protein
MAAGSNHCAPYRDDAGAAAAAAATTAAERALVDAIAAIAA